MATKLGVHEPELFLQTDKEISETLPKALRTQALTALASNFGLVGLVQGRRQKKMGICGKNFQTSKFALNPDLLNCFLEIWYILYGTW